MIHIAPCYCQLHVRIRELEAELVKRTTGLERTVHDNRMAYEREKARAEKAEHERDVLSRHDEKDGREILRLRSALDEVLGSRRVLEARVAELEQWLPHIKWELGISAASGCPNCAEPLAAIERGEREEC